MRNCNERRRIYIHRPLFSFVIIINSGISESIVNRVESQPNFAAAIINFLMYLFCESFPVYISRPFRKSNESLGFLLVEPDLISGDRSNASYEDRNESRLQNGKRRRHEVRFYYENLMQHTIAYAWDIYASGAHMCTYVQRCT